MGWRRNVGLAGAPEGSSAITSSRRLILGAVLIALSAIVLLSAQAIKDARLTAPPPTPLIYDRSWHFLADIPADPVASRARERQVDHGYWPLSRAPDRVARATLALEDRRFYDHPGIDPVAVVRAAWHNLTRSRHRVGASTIAMQVARMQRPASRNIWAKLRESAAALALTWRFGREQLLAHYLRLVPYGNGSHGIAYAARWYFDKPTEDLSWAEIALLSAVPQSPTSNNLLRPDGLERAKRRGHRILDELTRQQVINAPEATLAHRQLAEMPMPRPPRRPDALHAIIRYEAMAREGRLVPPDPGDPRIRATIDLDLQKKVTELARRYQAAWGGAGAEQIAVMVVERRTGAVLADVGSVGYYDSPAGAINFSRVPRSPGSTLKPFIYAFAIEQGLLRPTDVMADLPDGAAGINNADGHFLGPMLPRQALANSRNIPATNLVRTVGLNRTFRFLRDVGVHDLEVPPEQFGLSIAIGSLPTTLERLMHAYGALADDGRLADLIWYSGQQRRLPVQVLSASTARLITSFLADPLARLPSFPRYGSSEYPFPVALKTGTSQGYHDAWTVAWSHDYLVGVWVGRSDAGTMAQMTGAGSAARLVHALLLRLHDARPGDLKDLDFQPPEGRVPVELCVIGGLRSTGNCGQTLTEWVRPDEMPAEDRRTAASPGRTSVAILPAEERAWAKEQGYAVGETATPLAMSQGKVRLAIASPENESHLWRNPETPPTLARLSLKAVVDPHVPQIVWYADGEPFAIEDPDRPVQWPIKPGTHTFRIRLPLQEAASPVVRIVVE